MRRTFVTCAAFVLAAALGPLSCGNPGRVMIDGVVVTLPADTEWVTAETTSQHARLELDRDGGLVTLDLSATPVEPFAEGDEFLRSAEHTLDTQFSAQKKVSIHYNWSNEDGAACVRYDGILEDTTAAGASPFTTLRGGVCRHPKRGTLMVRVELAQRSDTREAAYAIDLAALARGVFDGIAFVEPSRPE